ncbi:LacI family DNA-binding transcriptional regulator [Pseudokineococcus lusitanus]|uniref:DNA-binding LacI/PurR family transcriptional regulator n=1 Tax=Pseudokineococcus lusitanus TaxID=763993 RepID=A0A3N1HLJ6_9ACTN|nr:LacI family DNA-binding transcriptional regulator [Pseudokineococcus lusitanus]ROP43370.1 DNA-binding LacI/PurR family transcriptional regulator [Pseudokineococcus lusitanus]
MRARLVDVAARAGVSEATVSRVLNGRPGVSAATTRRVLVAVDTLGLERPARLVTSSAGLVALVVPDLDDVAHPVLVRELTDRLALRGLSPVLEVPPPGAGAAVEAERLEAVVGRGVVGLVLVGGRHTDPAADLAPHRALAAGGLPVVAVGAAAGRPEGRALEVPVVAVDDAAAADLAVAHLVALGHRRLGVVTGTGRSAPAARRVAGFERALRARLGVESATGLVVRTSPTVEGGQEAVVRLRERRVTAVLTTSLPLALGVLRGARQAGLRVPEDLSVVGHDDLPLVCDFTDPPLTTLRPPLPAMAGAAVTALLGDAEERLPRELAFRADLVVRGTTAAAPAG